MRPFEYVSPKTQAQAFSLLAGSWEQSEVLAGGTDLLALMKDDVIRPKRLVNIKGIGDLHGIQRLKNGSWRIGALTTLGDLAELPEVQSGLMKEYPAFAEAVNEAASPQIRSMATLGGNLCQRPRCWYFRNGFGLLPQEAGKDLVSAGDNRYHAIIANEGRAKFVSPSTIVPILIAYNAKVELAGPNGKRELPLEKFFVIPKTENEREHDLRPNEVLTGVVLPSSQGIKASHYEIRQKAAFDWPLALSAVALKMDGRNVAAARVVLGYVAPTPWLSPAAEQELVGKPLTEQTAQAAADAALKIATPLSHNAYKVQLAKVALKRAIVKAGGAA